jgi:diacylglycerol kinase (ATP)
MEEQAAFSFSGRIRSFRYAFRGVRLILTSQHNAWVHFAATIAVIIAGTFARLGRDEWCWLIIVMMAVWTAEALNTAFELLCDVASPDFHPIVEKAKDAAAGAVVLSAVGSVAVGLLIFTPHMMSVIR